MLRIKFIIQAQPSNGAGYEQEVRRTRISTDCSFEELLQKLRNWGDGLSEITYTDNDGDKVTVTSQDEWEECKDLRLLTSQEDDPLRPLVLRVYLESLTKKKISELSAAPPKDKSQQSLEEAESPTPPIPEILDAIFDKVDVLTSLKDGSCTPADLGASEWLLIKRCDAHIDVDINLKFLYDLMIAKGVACLGHNDMSTSALWFSRCTLILPQNPLGWYNLACCCAVSGLANSAVSHLERAFDCGYSKPAHLISDPDLELIRGHPRFISLRKRVTPSVQMLRRRRSAESARHVNFLISEESDSDDEDDESTPFLGSSNFAIPEDPFISMEGL
eukprot:TRINITY_DN12705_c0_g1_i1.p1 TRINITY_DN12705_c0_g1~~TRINITY_DN12705_c0_g1_i1.p1  ORF type:complete len:332 (+),score=40.02 TRINITY_DN12705_c0_g1_i1:43-1038(+)